MQLKAVQSSRIKAIGYDEDTWTCYVQFQPTGRELQGTIYAYANVSPETFQGFVDATSKGRFFGQHLADREGHPALRLGEPHTRAASLPSPAPGVLMFRAMEGATPKVGQRGRSSKAQAGHSPGLPAVAGADELKQIAREREILLEFFRPMRESTLAAYHAVVEKEEQALAQFQAAEAALAARMPRPHGQARSGGRS